MHNRSRGLEIYIISAPSLPPPLLCVFLSSSLALILLFCLHFSIFVFLHPSFSSFWLQSSGCLIPFASIFVSFPVFSTFVLVPFITLSASVSPLSLSLFSLSPSHQSLQKLLLEMGLRQEAVERKRDGKYKGQSFSGQAENRLDSVIHVETHVIMDI